ncbi:uncharacterized protein LOC126273368 [Schistocerca gregaria]|uniref:uncharacterized protein LOC126273368 n=1 Tax=Schistocerca gregaria TaxID=7010 RepID=UPI00211F2CDB|nr:uncharacterized protein LOC126273368 [Schistocerca gregaria]
MRAPGRRPLPPPLSELCRLILILSLWLGLLPRLASAGPAPRPALVHRHHHGDMVVVASGGVSCGPEACSALGARPSNPASAPAEEAAGCACRCPGNAPAFREDLAACVADITECPVLDFRSPPGPPQKLPFVFLPLRGQIVHPSADIALPDPELCPVVGWRSLGLRGWSDAVTAGDAFSLFTVDGSVFLQWLGPASLRRELEGRLVVVSLSCGRCVALRVAGSVAESGDSSASEAHFPPSAVASGSTVLGADLADAGPLEAEEDAGGGGGEASGGSTYLLVGAVGGALAAAYVVAVLLYLARHRRRSADRQRQKDAEAAAAAGAAEAASKAAAAAASKAARRPTLLRRHHSFSLESEDTDYSGGGCSDYDEHYPDFKQVEAALLEPAGCLLVSGASSGASECLPEEALQIVETADLALTGSGGGGGGGGYARQPPVGAEMQGRGPPAAVRPLQAHHHRRRLYFNPVFFEPDMLKSPPLAALEFLSKLREVVSLSKSRLAARRFAPCLMPIAEGEDEGPAAAVPALLAVETSDSEARRLMNEVLRELRQAAAVAADRGSSPAAPSQPAPAPAPDTTPAATPSPTATLPLDEEMTAANDVLRQTAPEQAGTAYNLISEVYVNGSADQGSERDQQTAADPAVTYQGQPGHLTIQVEDNPAAYEYNPDDYSSFEPDTLDRKAGSQHQREGGVAREQPQPGQDATLTSLRSLDSLERPGHILLRTSGSFRNDSITRSAAASTEPAPAAAPFTRAYGSLREIFEARTRGRERRVAQAQQSPCPHLQPEVEAESPPPLPPKTSAPIYQAPCWPARPVLPRSRSLTDHRGCGAGRTTWARRAASPSPSSDSLDSGGADADADYEECDVSRSAHQRLLGSWSPATPQESHSSSPGPGGSVSAGCGSLSDSEADGSLCDGASESGGESVATDSVFFGSFRKVATCVATVPDDRLREALSGLAAGKRHRS